MFSLFVHVLIAAYVETVDHTRVKLVRGDDDYINASLITVEVADRAYILTQVTCQGRLVKTSCLSLVPRALLNPFRHSGPSAAYYWTLLVNDMGAKDARYLDA